MDRINRAPSTMPTTAAAARQSQRQSEASSSLSNISNRDGAPRAGAGAGHEAPFPAAHSSWAEPPKFTAYKRPFSNVDAGTDPEVLLTKHLIKFGRTFEQNRDRLVTNQLNTPALEKCLAHRQDEILQLDNWECMQRIKIANDEGANYCVPSKPDAGHACFQLYKIESDGEAPEAMRGQVVYQDQREQWQRLKKVSEGSSAT